MANEIDSNPYAAPESLNDKLAATEHDRFIVEQVTSLLKPKERVRMTACVVKTLPLRARIALVVLVGLCGVLTRAFIPPSVLPRFLIIPASFVLFGLILSSIYLRLVQVYLVAVTKRRMILIRAPLGPFGPRLRNLGFEQIRWKEVDHVVTGGLANNRSLQFVFRDGGKRTLRIAPRLKFVSGQAKFFEFAQNFRAAMDEQEPSVHRTCAQCSASNDGDADFCTKCGARIAGA